MTNVHRYIVSGRIRRSVRSDVQCAAAAAAAAVVRDVLCRSAPQIRVKKSGPRSLFVAAVAKSPFFFFFSLSAFSPSVPRRPDVVD